MSRWHRVRRVANSLLSGIQLPNRQDLVDPFFKKLQAFGWCERKRPADKRQVHAVFAVLRTWGAIDGIDIRIHYSASITLFMQRLQQWHANLPMEQGWQLLGRTEIKEGEAFHYRAEKLPLRRRILSSELSVSVRHTHVNWENP